VAFRPTIARGLALSLNAIQGFFCYPDMSNFNAKTIYSYNGLIFNGFQKNRVSHQQRFMTFF
jgi:hypothetical protein